MSSQQFREYREPRSSRMGLGVAIGVVIALLLAALAVALAMLFEVFPFDGTPDDPPPVFTEIQDLNQLTTTRWIGQVVVTEDADPGRVERIAGILGLDASALTGESVIITATGEVEAGVNLDEMAEGDVRVNGESVTINLPEAEILSTSLDEDRTGVYDRDRGIFVRGIDDALVEDARRDAEQRIEETAAESGILEQADANAENNLRGFIESLGFEDVDFE